MQFKTNHCVILPVGLQQPQEQHYPFLPVGAVFSSVQTMVWMPVLGILTCAQTLKHAVAHRVTVWESALKTGSGRKTELHACKTVGTVGQKPNRHRYIGS